jgi:hypothetical protein
MTQNLKIVLNNTKNLYPNNINFGDTITIKANSKIALTSFNASFDINKEGRVLNDQIFQFLANNDATINLLPKDVIIPSQTYYHLSDLDFEINRLVNNSISAYEEGNEGNEENLLGMGFSLKIDKDKTLFNLDFYALEQFTYPLDSTDFTIDEHGYYTTEVEDAELLLELDNDLTGKPSKSLMKGGGVCYQYGENFNFIDETLNSYMELRDQKGDYMRLYYKVVKSTEEDNKSMNLYVAIRKNNVIVEHTISNDFYNWTESNESGNSSGLGPWKNKATAKNDYFMWYQKNNTWNIVYYDLNDATNEYEYKDVFKNGLDFNINANYKFTKYIKQAKTKNANFNADLNKATFETKLTGTKKIESLFKFDRCDDLIEIYNLSNIGEFVPKDAYSSTYTPNGTTSFYPNQNFEIACEIDTIKIKNYVGNASNEGNQSNGRRNILAYFTPESSIYQSKYIYRYDPSNPIYLSVDSSTNIDLNSLGIRFFNTYSNKGIQADSITAVITNMEQSSNN